MTSSKYGKILAIATMVCAILLGIMFIICTAHLYFTGGDTPYSAERVGGYLKVVAIPSFVTIALMIAGFVYAYVTDAKEDELTARTDSELLESFASRYEFASFDEETRSEINKIKKKQSVVDFITAEVSALCFVFIIDYFLFIADFSVDNLSADVMAAFAVVLPLSAIAVAIHIPRIYMAEKSSALELSLLKKSIKEQGAPAVSKKTSDDKKKDYSAYIKCALVVIAVAFVIVGAFNGGMVDVLQKAVKICTECIGLG